MKEIPDLCDDVAYFGTMCLNFGAPHQRVKLLIKQALDVVVGNRG
jgi:hypothetical protein